MLVLNLCDVQELSPSLFQFKNRFFSVVQVNLEFNSAILACRKFLDENTFSIVIQKPDNKYILLRIIDSPEEIAKAAILSRQISSNSSTNNLSEQGQAAIMVDTIQKRNLEEDMRCYRGIKSKVQRTEEQEPSSPHILEQNVRLYRGQKY